MNTDTAKPTPGQAAYEAFYGSFPGDWLPFSQLADELRDAWAEAERAVEPAILAWQSQVEYFRELVAEILDRAVFSVNEYELVAEWRQRAGLEG